MAKCLRNGGSSKRFLSRSSRSSMSRIRALSRETSTLGLDAVAAQDRHRHALALLEHGGKQIGRLDRLPARAARVVQRQLEDELGRRRDAQVAAGERRHQVQVLLDRLQDGVRIQLDVAHDLGEHVPLDLREREENVLVGQQRMLPPPGLLERAIDDSLRGFAQSCWVRCRDRLRARPLLHPARSTSKTGATPARDRADGRSDATDSPAKSSRAAEGCVAGRPHPRLGGLVLSQR